MQQYEMFELRFTGPQPGTDEVNVLLKAIFTIDGKDIAVDGYYAGEGCYAIRFLPLVTGTCQISIQTNLKLHAMQPVPETIEVAPHDPQQHGPVHACAQHFEYADGTKYLPFGTTVYALLYQEPALIKQTMATLQQSTFNKVRLCLFPKYFDFNRAEPEYFPFEKNPDGSWNVEKPYFPFWNLVDEQLAALLQAGIQAELILLHPYDHWGLSELSLAECQTYLSYVLRRYGAFSNVWWSLANEYELVEGIDQHGWETLAKYVSQHEQYRHLLSNHNFVHPWTFENQYVTHCCLQQSDSNLIPELLKEYQKPVIFDEIGYEGNLPYSWGNLSGFEEVNRFWKICCMGGYATHGETFIESMDQSQVLWWSKGGTLKGESEPRIRFMREVFDTLPGVPTLYEAHNLPFATQEELRTQIQARVPAVIDNQVFRCMAKITPAEFQHMLQFFTEPIVHVDERVYIKYLGDQCTLYTTLRLPDDHQYRIEVIDVWAMTRREVLAHASGETEIRLPAKAGIAVMATALAQ